MTRPGLTPVPDQGPEEYSISVHDRVDAHYFLQWNLKRWRGSDFRKKAYSDPEVGFYAFELFCKSQDEAPIGTLPNDDEALAFMLHLPLERWRSLRARPLSPLYGWRQVRCDNGDIRLGHRIVEMIAKEAIKSKRGNEEKADRRKVTKRLSDLTEMVRRIGAAQLLNKAGFVESFDAWLTEHRGGRYRTEPMIREALDEFTLEQSP